MAVQSITDEQVACGGFASMLDSWLANGCLFVREVSGCARCAPLVLLRRAAIAAAAPKRGTGKGGMDDASNQRLPVSEYRHWQTVGVFYGRSSLRGMRCNWHMESHVAPTVTAGAKCFLPYDLAGIAGVNLPL